MCSNPGVALSGSIFRLVADALVRAGVDATEIVRRTGVERTHWGEGWVSDDAEEALWRLAADRVPDVAVRAAKALPRGAFHGLEYAFRSAPTVEAALRVLVRFQDILHGTTLFEYEEGVLRYRPPHDEPRVRAVASEFSVACLVRITDDIADVPRVAERVEFAHPRPAHAEALDEILGVGAAYGRPSTFVHFSPAALARRSREADPALHRLMQQWVASELHRVPRASWTSRVRETIRDELLEGEVSLAGVAQTLGLSERALQHRLKEEGTTFRDELEHARHGLAVHLLGYDHLSLSDIALMLGYAEQSTFQRAFKRWCGETPGRYRRALSRPLRSWTPTPRSR